MRQLWLQGRPGRHAILRRAAVGRFVTKLYNTCSGDQTIGYHTACAGQKVDCPSLLASAKEPVCTTVGPPSADAYDRRALPCPAPCRARVAPAPQRPRRAIALLGTPAPSNFAGRARAGANPVAARRRSISCDSSRATCPPAFLRRFHPEELQDTEPESLKIHAAPSALRITTRRRIAGGVRRTGDRRPSDRGAGSAADRGAISARVPPSSPSRHARTTRQPCTPLHSARTTPANRKHHNGRAAALECGQDDPPHDLLRHQPLQSPGIQAHHPQVCPPARPAITHA